MTYGIIFGMAFIIILIAFIFRRKTYKNLLIALQNEDYDTFNKLVTKVTTRFLFGKYTLTNMQFNAAVLQNDKKSANKLLEELEKMSLSKKQKDKLYMQAFNYFVGLEDKKGAKKYIKKINESQNARMKLEANRVYNIYILKNDNDLNDLLEELDDMEDSKKAVHEYLISLIYENKKDKKNAEKYRKLSEKHMQMLDEAIKAKQRK